MRLLLIHAENRYFAGAEKMLGYYLAELAHHHLNVTVAAVAGSRVRELVPDTMRQIELVDNQRFSPLQLTRQMGQLAQAHRQARFDMVHGWAARDWELTALWGRLVRIPTLGTLHDHPQAPFHSSGRQRLMRWSARWGLSRVLAVSEAVRQACLAAGYPAGKLRVIHNGLPIASAGSRLRSSGPSRLGFLGAFSERKGLRGLFQMLDCLAAKTSVSWEVHLAGEPQDDAGADMVKALKDQYRAKPWWPQVHWHGWVEQPQEFLKSLDLLICPSAEFDPFPTILLEAGQTSLPVVATRVGGVPEIIREGETGWLFDPGDWAQGAGQIAALLPDPGRVFEAGQRAAQRLRAEFPIAKMVAQHLEVYSNLRHDE
jgi:glycosyltransferase involved in cell wall biosynthesis